MKVILGTLGAIYLAMLGKALVPQRDSVTLYVDPTGVYANNKLVAARADITEAYVRPAIAARTHRTTHSIGSTAMRFGLRLPDYPLTVELITRRRGQFNIDPGGLENAAGILTALGIPVTVCAPDYHATNGPVLKQLGIVALILIGTAIFAAASAYIAYLTYRIN